MREKLRLLCDKLIARNRKYYVRALRFDFSIFFEIKLLKIVTFRLS
jgi:hypothetical protein